MLDRVREFAELQARPRALEIDRRAGEDPRYFDWDLVRAGAEHRLLSLAIPPAAGGQSSEIVTTALAMEELCAACPGIANIFGAHALGLVPLLLTGIEHWDGLLGAVSAAERRGEPLLAAFAITEPGAGTDAQNPELMRRGRMSAVARRVPGGFKLEGTKHFISNGSVASWVTVAMPTDLRRPVETLTYFLVDARSAGYSVASVEHKMGQRACPAAELVFDGVFVPDERVVGREGDGMAITLMGLTASRPGVGAIGTGIARGAYERVLAWAERDPAARGLLDDQRAQLALARMEEEIRLARQAYVEAASAFDRAMSAAQGNLLVRALALVPPELRGRRRMRRLMTSPQARERVAQTLARTADDRRLTEALGLASLAKARGTDVAVRVTGMALELAGLDAGPVRAELEKLWRDAKLTQIYEGTNQLNRLEVFAALCRGETTPILPRAVAA